ncbi:MAG: hypothetical protein ACE5KU_05535 [Nitrososphaerales archaeon]
MSIENLLQPVESDVERFLTVNRGRALFAEPKYDGHRVLLHVGKNGVRGWSRAGNEAVFTPALLREVHQLPAGDYDTEMHVPGRPASQVSRLETDKHLLIFDVIRDGVYAERRRFIAEALNKISPYGCFRLEIPKSVWVNGSGIKGREEERLDWIRRIALDFIEEGYEGAVVKADVEYQSSHAWLKVKKLQSGDFIILGVNTRKKSWLERREARSLLIGCYEDEVLREVGEATHPNPVDWSKLMTGETRGVFLLVRPMVAVEVEFQEETEDGRLRHAIIKRVRTDKPAESCRGAAEARKSVRV